MIEGRALADGGWGTLSGNPELSTQVEKESQKRKGTSEGGGSEEPGCSMLTVTDT